MFSRQRAVVWEQRQALTEEEEEEEEGYWRTSTRGECSDGTTLVQWGGCYRPAGPRALRPRSEGEEAISSRNQNF